MLEEHKKTIESHNLPTFQVFLLLPTFQVVYWADDVYGVVLKLPCFHTSQGKENLWYHVGHVVISHNLVFSASALQ